MEREGAWGWFCWSDHTPLINIKAFFFSKRDINVESRILRGGTGVSCCQLGKTINTYKFWQQWYFITADLPMNPCTGTIIVSLYFSCDFLVMFQIVSKRKFFTKQHPSQKLPYTIKLLFKLHKLYFTDVQNILKNISYSTKQ